MSIYFLIYGPLLKVVNFTCSTLCVHYLPIECDDIRRKEGRGAKVGVVDWEAELFRREAIVASFLTREFVGILREFEKKTHLSTC